MALRIALALALIALTVVATTQPSAPTSGLDVAAFDRSVRPQDDLFQHVNGAWLAGAVIPADRVHFGSFQELGMKVEEDLHAIIQEIARKPDAWGSEGRQIADLYDSVMDEPRIEAAGIAPVLPQLRRLQSIASHEDVAREAGHLSAIGDGGPFDGEVGDDPRQPGAIGVRVRQGGTLLPDRDHYLGGAPRYGAIRAEYEKYLTTILSLAGSRRARDEARAVLAFETELARAQWTVEESRDASRADARFRLDRMGREMPGFDWIAWARPQGIDRASVVVLAQPSFFAQFAAIVAGTPVETLRAWLTTRYLTAVAPFVPRAFADARFEFFGRLLTGQEAPTERWRRGVSLVNGYLGDALGRAYVRKHVAASTRARVRSLVDTIVAAYRDAVAASDWLSPRAKAEARLKLSRLRAKIAYPDAWRSYRSLEIRRGDLVGNITRGRRHDAALRLAASRGELDPGVWMIPPQTVNAYYSPAANEMVVPAAMLQPPFFDTAAEDAVNYGAIGAIVGHEIGHSLDDRGRFFDAAGRARDWWTAADAAAYVRRVTVLVEQFSGYEPVPGARMDGIRTLRESIGDLGGLTIAYAAYQRSLAGGSAPVIDGLTGDQRFFMAWARAWRSKERDDYLRQWVITIPHAPPRFRVNGIVAHVPAFYAAFDLKPGDRLYRQAGRRVRIW